MEHFQDQPQHVIFILAGEEGFPRQQFAENAAYCPNVDLLAVLVVDYQEFGRAVPPG